MDQETRATGGGPNTQGRPKKKAVMEMERRRPGRPKKPGGPKPREIDLEAAAASAAQYRARMRSEGYVVMHVWVPREMRQELMEMVHAEVERHLALKVKLESSRRSSWR